MIKQLNKKVAESVIWASKESIIRNSLLLLSFDENINKRPLIDKKLNKVYALIKLFLKNEGYSLKEKIVPTLFRDFIDAELVNKEDFCYCRVLEVTFKRNKALNLIEKFDEEIQKLFLEILKNENSSYEDILVKNSFYNTFANLHLKERLNQKLYIYKNDDTIFISKVFEHSEGFYKSNPDESYNLQIKSDYSINYYNYDFNYEHLRAEKELKELHISDLLENFIKDGILYSTYEHEEKRNSIYYFVSSVFEIFLPLLKKISPVFEETFKTIFEELKLEQSERKFDDETFKTLLDKIEKERKI